MSPSANADEPDAQFFRSPTGNISCEMDFGRLGLPNGVFCMTRTPPQNVFMDINGVLRICSGEDRCLADAPENETELPYGQNVTLGPFTCLSEDTGMNCTIGSGHGFLISDSGVVPVDPRG